jgi:hypothetical protein
MFKTFRSWLGKLLEIGDIEVSDELDKNLLHPNVVTGQTQLTPEQCVYPPIIRFNTNGDLPLQEILTISVIRSDLPALEIEANLVLIPGRMTWKPIKIVFRDSHNKISAWVGAQLQKQMNFNGMPYKFNFEIEDDNDIWYIEGAFMSNVEYDDFDDNSPMQIDVTIHYDIATKRNKKMKFDTNYPVYLGVSKSFFNALQTSGRLTNVRGLKFTDSLSKAEYYARLEAAKLEEPVGVVLKFDTAKLFNHPVFFSSLLEDLIDTVFDFITGFYDVVVEIIIVDEGGDYT